MSKYFIIFALFIINIAFGSIKRDSIILNNDTTVICSVYSKNSRLMRVYSKTNGKKNGESKIWHKNGQIKSIINYKLDRVVNTIFTYYKSGKIESISPQNGVAIVYKENGDTLGIGNYKNGKHSGVFKSWWKKGIPKSFTNYNSTGKKHGLCETWRKDGTRKDSVVYENGEIVTGRYYFENGKIRFTSKWKNGLKIEMVSYYPSGKKCGEIKSGTGEIKLFVEDGTKSFQYIYKNGKRVD